MLTFSPILPGKLHQKDSEALVFESIHISQTRQVGSAARPQLGDINLRGA